MPHTHKKNVNICFACQQILLIKQSLNISGTQQKELLFCSYVSNYSFIAYFNSLHAFSFLLLATSREIIALLFVLRNNITKISFTERKNSSKLFCYLVKIRRFYSRTCLKKDTNLENFNQLLGNKDFDDPFFKQGSVFEESCLKI